MSESHLTPVPDVGPAAPGEPDRASASPESALATEEHKPVRRWLLVALGVALALTLALLVWSRLELARTTTEFEGRISALQGEVGSLQSELRGRELVIDAQRNRLGEVRDGVATLQRLLDEPLPD